MTEDSKTARDSYIVSDYKAGMQIGEIARANSLTERRITQILESRGVALRPRTALAERKALSRIHEMIGRKMIDYRFNRDLQPNEVANALGWSLTKLRKVEQGVTTLELLDLLDVSAYIGETLTEMVTSVKPQ